MIKQTGKFLLAQGLEHGDGDAVAQVQAPGLGTHGDAHAAVPMLLQKGFGQALRLLAEKQVAAIGKLRLGVAPGGLGGQAPHLTHIVSGEEIVQAFVIEDLHQMPVVKTGTADRLFGDVEAQGPDQVQPGAGGGAGAGDISAVLRDLRLHEHHVQQRSFTSVSIRNAAE